jgi:hypothetical protein
MLCKYIIVIKINNIKNIINIVLINRADAIDIKGVQIYVIILINAAILSKILIPDGNYFKMIGEIGILGTFLFFAILISSFWRGFKDLKNKYLDLGIIFCICPPIPLFEFTASDSCLRYLVKLGMFF